MKDERIETTINRIARGGYFIWYVLTLISLNYRLWILKQHPWEFWDFFAILLIVSLYGFIALASKGAFEQRFKKTWLTIGITVINTGELTGRHDVVLNINDAAVETKEVTLAEGVRQLVTFTVTEDAMGTYHVTIGGQTGKFDVLTPPSETNWWLLMIIIVTSGALVYFIVKARREPEQSPD